jgi:hypothetical protein
VKMDLDEQKNQEELRERLLIINEEEEKQT